MGSSTPDWSISAQTVGGAKETKWGHLVTSPNKRHSTPVSGHSDAPRAHLGAARDLQASGWKVLLSGLMGVMCGPKKPRVGHYLNFSSNASQVWGLACQVTSLLLNHCFPTESGKKENQAHRMVGGLTGMTWIKHLACSANGSSFPFLCPFGFFCGETFSSPRRWISQSNRNP